MATAAVATAAAVTVAVPAFVVEQCLTVPLNETKFNFVFLRFQHQLNILRHLLDERRHVRIGFAIVLDQLERVRSNVVRVEDLAWAARLGKGHDLVAVPRREKIPRYFYNVVDVIRVVQLVLPTD